MKDKYPRSLLLIPWVYSHERGSNSVGLHVSRFYDGTHRIELGFWWFSLVWLTQNPELP